MDPLKRLGSLALPNVKTDWASHPTTDKTPHYGPLRPVCALCFSAYRCCGTLTHLPLRHGQDLVTKNDGVQPVSDGEGGALSKHATDGALDQGISLQPHSREAEQGIACDSWKELD